MQPNDFDVAGNEDALFFCVARRSKDRCTDIPQGNRNASDIHRKDPGDGKQAGTGREQDQDNLKIRQVQGTARFLDGILRHDFNYPDEGNMAIRLPVYKLPAHQPMRQIATAPALTKLHRILRSIPAFAAVCRRAKVRLETSIKINSVCRPH